MVSAQSCSSASRALHPHYEPELRLLTLDPRPRQGQRGRQRHPRRLRGAVRAARARRGRLPVHHQPAHQQVGQPDLHRRRRRHRTASAGPTSASRPTSAASARSSSDCATSRSSPSRSTHGVTLGWGLESCSPPTTAWPRRRPASACRRRASASSPAPAVRRSWRSRWVRRTRCDSAAPARRSAPTRRCGSVCATKWCRRSTQVSPACAPSPNSCDDAPRRPSRCSSVAFWGPQVRPRQSACASRPPRTNAVSIPVRPRSDGLRSARFAREKCHRGGPRRS